MDTNRYKELRQKLKAAFDEAGADMKLSNVKSLTGTDSEKVAQLKSMNAELDGLKAEYAEMEAAMKDREATGAPAPVAGEATIKAATRIPGWKAGYWSKPFLEQTIGTGFDHEVKAGLISTGTATVPSLTGGIVPINDRPMRLLDVIPRERLSDTDTYAYLREMTREHKAAETAKSTLKPTSKYQVKKIEGTVKTVAHLSEPVARQDLEDARLLTQYVEGSLRQGVELRLDQQILSGDGEGQNLTGLAATEGIQEQTWTTDLLTTSRKALTKLEAKEIPTGVFVMGQSHWEALELLSTEDGIKILGGPVDRAERRLWGQPVITTSLLSSKLAYLVDFQGSTKLWERGGVRVDWSEAPEGSVEGEAAFKTNELIFRGEGRYGFGVTRPAGVVEFATAE